MELRHLRYFLAVAEEGHFGRAAERLHIVQPALSMQIRALEDELGTALFVRTSRKVALTEAGAILVDEARRTLGQAQRAQELVRMSARGEVGTVRIGFSGNASFAGKLAGDLRRFHLQCAQVAIDLRETSPRRQIDAILAGELDVGYCPTFDHTLHPDLGAERIGTWPWTIALHLTHPLTGRRSLRGADLRGERFVLYAADDTETTQRDLLRSILGHEPAVAHSAGSTLTVLTMASAGLGLGLVPAPLATLSFPGLAFRPLDGLQATADLMLVYRLQETSGAVRRFLDHARG